MKGGAERRGPFPAFTRNERRIVMLTCSWHSPLGTIRHPGCGSSPNPLGRRRPCRSWVRAARRPRCNVRFKCRVFSKFGAPIFLFSSHLHSFENPPFSVCFTVCLCLMRTWTSGRGARTKEGPARNEPMEGRPAKNRPTLSTASRNSDWHFVP